MFTTQAVVVHHFAKTRRHYLCEALAKVDRRTEWQGAGLSDFSSLTEICCTTEIVVLVWPHRVNRNDHQSVFSFSSNGRVLTLLENASQMHGMPF